LSKSCQWENCTNDGYHRARFVNRWKAQILLNSICHVEYWALTFRSRMLYDVWKTKGFCGAVPSCWISSLVV
jgi:hypothetical protein